MNADIKAKWVTALRSGEYQQTKGALCKEGAFCCLGVLSDLYIKETNQGVWVPDGSEMTFKQFRYDKYGDYVEINNELPEPVMEWAGLQSQAPDARLPNKTINLIKANDEGMPFPAIADIIEAHL